MIMSKKSNILTLNGKTYKLVEKEKTAKKSDWQKFMKGKMSKYMKSEGSHQGAMKRLSKEWKAYKKKK